MKHITLSPVVRTIVPALALGLSVAACDDGTETPTQIEGQFQTRGYGYGLEADGTTATVYELTEISCVKVISGSVVGLTLPDLDMKAHFEAGALVLEDGGTMHLVADRKPLPATCKNGGTPPTADALVNFDILKAAFSEQYAFFDLHGVDWEKHTAAYRARLSSTSTEDELMQVFCEMLPALNDGHVSIASRSKVCSGTPVTEESMTSLETLTEYVKTLPSNGTSDAGGVLNYGTLAPGVGYIGIAEMIFEGKTSSEQEEQAGQAIDRALAALGDVGHLVVDVRANQGGLDAVSLAIAGRFTDVSRVAYTKQARNGKGYTPERTVTVKPLGPKTYKGKVSLLTSRFTASAAETFSLMMRTIPNVTIIGEHTSGAFSDVLSRMLPNGMAVGLSNEVYRAVDGKIYEGLGVPPSVSVLLNVAELAAGKDAALDAALGRP